MLWRLALEARNPPCSMHLRVARLPRGSPSFAPPLCLWAAAALRRRPPQWAARRAIRTPPPKPPPCPAFGPALLTGLLSCIMTNKRRPVLLLLLATPARRAGCKPG